MPLSGNLKIVFDQEHEYEHDRPAAIERVFLSPLRRRPFHIHLKLVGGIRRRHFKLDP